MRAVFGLVLVAGIALAGFAVYMVKGYFDQTQYALDVERAAAAARLPTVDVYTVNRAMEYGEMITAADLQIIPYPEPFLPEGVFRTEAELFPQGPDVQRVVLRPMEAFEPILAAKVTEPGESAGLTSRLSAGMRAFAINVDVSSGVSGFLRPGDRIDIYWTGTVDALGGSEVTKLIETGVKIVAVDQDAEGNASGVMVARTVTVEVSPQQVASLAQAQSTGSLSLSLVGTDDEIVAEAIQVNQQTLLGIQAPAPEAAPEAPEPEKVCTIRTRRGAEVVEIPIPCTE